MDLALIILQGIIGLIIAVGFLGAMVGLQSEARTSEALSLASARMDAECDSAARAESALSAVSVTLECESTVGESVRVLLIRNVSAPNGRVAPVRARLSPTALATVGLSPRRAVGESDRVALVSGYPVLLSPRRRARARRESGYELIAA